MDTTIILEAFISILLEKGIEALGKPLKRATKRLWKRLHKSDPRFSQDPTTLTLNQTNDIADALDELAREDPSFRKILDAWKREVVATYPETRANIKAVNQVSGIAIGSQINQSNHVDMSL